MEDGRDNETRPEQTEPEQPDTGMPRDGRSMNVLSAPWVLLYFAWGMVKEHGNVLVPIFFIPSFLTLVGEVLFAYGKFGSAIAGGVIGIAGAILSIAMQPAIIDAIHRRSLDPQAPVSFAGQYRFGFRLFFSMLLVIIIEILAGVGSVLLLVIPFIIMAVYSCVYIFTFTLDGKRGLQPFIESYSLITGRWLDVALRLLFIVIVSSASWLVLRGLGFIMALVSGLSEDAVMLPINLVGSVLIGLIMTSYMYFLYLSLKVSREEKPEVEIVDGDEAAAGASAFKNWVIIFLCIGGAAIIATMAIAPQLIQRIGII